MKNKANHCMQRTRRLRFLFMLRGHLRRAADAVRRSFDTHGHFAIHFHDTKIHRVIEDAYAKTLTMEVTYPVDWERNVFEKRLLIFEDVHHYQVMEWELFGGEPTILDVEIVSTDDRWSRLRLETNAGHRELSCDAVRVSECDSAP